MNCKNSIVAFVIAVLFFPMVVAGQSISQTLGKAVSDYDIVKLNADQLLTDLQAKDYDGNLEFKLRKDLNFTLDLIDSKVLADSYFAISESGARAEDRLIYTLQGTIKDQPASIVRLTIAKDFIYGFIREDADHIWFFEPAGYYDDTFNASWYVVYNQKDVKLSDKGWCGANETLTRKLKLKEQVGGDRLPGSCFEVELAIASDFSMYQKYGNSIPGVENHNIGVMNNVQGNYDNEFADEIFFVIVEQFVSTCSTCDPWTNSTDAGTLLNSFRNWGPTGFSATHDIGQLWTNRDFDGGTVGIAYVGVVCTSFRYHCLSDFTSNASWLRVMTAHEIGHNFDASHDPSGSNTIMAPVVSSATAWSAASITDIENHYLSRTCLATCPPPAPPTPEFYANYTNICEGSLIQFVDESINSPTSWNWSFPGGTPVSSTAQHPTVTYNNPGTFNVTLIATNVNGSNQITKNGYITVGSGGTEVLLYDNFQSGLGMWTIDNPDNSATWQAATVGGSIAGNGVAKMDNYNYFGGNGDADALISPVIDLTGRANAQLNIQYAYARYNSTTTDSLNVWVSTNGGVSYGTLVYNKAENGSGNFATVPDQTTAFTPANPTDWCYASTYNNNGCISIDLSGFFNESNLVFKIENVSDYGNNMYIDNVTFVSDCQVIVPPVADFSSDEQIGCVPFVVQFFDQSQNSPDTWSWTFPGASPSSSNIQNPVVVYSNPGDFDVSLTVSNFAGSSSVTKNFYITALDVPDPSFLADINGNIVIFTNTTTGASSYLWQFGDGLTSTQENPVHTYAQDGQYTVTLTAFNSCGSEISSQIINIVTPPVANFTSNVTQGCAPLTVQFTDQSSSNTTSWLWTFPGGTPSSSTLENPQVVYNTPGTFDVTLQVSNAAGSNTIIKSNYITINDGPTAAYTYNVNDQLVVFTNSSTGANSYFWDFGDGSTSTLANPTHDFGMDGNYIVQLIATNTCGNDTIEQTIVISTLPEAGATANVTEGCAPLTVQFTDQSSSNVDTWLWIFEGGNPSSSTVQNPVVVYENPGVFDVILEVGNENGTDIINLINYITVEDGPTSNFNTSENQLDVDFINNSANADSYLWQFGDGTTSTQVNPSHTYASDGIYVVTLIAINSCGNDTTDLVLNLVSETMAGATADNTVGCIPFVVQFTDQSSSNVTNWNWTFVGGTPATSTQQNPLVQYNNTGIFDVQLIVSNAVYSDTLDLVDYIVVNDVPISTFNTNEDQLDVDFLNNSVNADSYFWDFGDGATSSLINPSHSYATDGMYTVSLIASNSCGNDTFITVLNLLSTVTAGAGADNTDGCVPFTVQFSDQSSSNVTNWNWTFEGGTPSNSTLQNPVVQYNSTGTFDVQLIASNADFSDTLLLLDYITVDDIPQSSFTQIIDELTVAFQNTSVNANSYFWDFGDGNTSTQTNPLHVYSMDGNYTVELIATNQCGNDTIVAILSIISPPDANAIADVTSGCVPLTVQFTDQSSSNVTNWSWSFEGGTPSSSNEQNPEVQYMNAGVFDVELIVSNSLYSDTLLLLNYVTVSSEPTSNYSSMINDLLVQFNNSSQGADSYFWDFGDGSSSNLQDPVHLYEMDGDYLVSLVSTNECGSDTLSQLVTVVSPPIANFSSDVNAGCVPLVVHYTDQSSENVNTWKWSFQGGIPAVSALQNPIVTYNNAGSFNVQLIVSNSEYSDTILFQQYIAVNNVPNAAFQVNTNGASVQFNNNSSNAESYMWQFGDGNISMEEDPEYTYAEEGSYLVTLISTNECGSDTVMQQINASSLPTANFQSNTDFACLPAEIQYSNLSSSNAESFEWFFEGGTPQVSTDANPLISYNNAGTFDVRLIAFSLSGSDTLYLEDYIVIGDIPTAAFDFSINENEVDFENLSLSGESYFWDFGNNTFSTDVNPTAVYSNDGVFTAELIVFNSCGQDTFQMDVNITAFPNAGFSSDITEGCSPIEVQFSDASTDNVTSWNWTFEGGTPASSNEQNPLVLYNSPGNYKVTLSVQNGVGENTLTLVDYILVVNAPFADFDFNIQESEVSFTNLSENSTFYFWDFGDEETSSDESPVHIYSESGTYEVVLIAGNEFCEDTITQQLQIEVSGIGTIDFVSQLFIVPNPASDWIYLSTESSREALVDIEIFNMIGQKVYKGIWGLVNGENEKSIDVSAFSSGTYLVKLSDKKGVFIENLIIE